MKGLKVVSFHENSGYGIAARLYIRALMNSALDITWTPMVRGKGLGMAYEPYQNIEIGDPEFDRICNKPIPYDTVLVHTIPEYYPHWREQEKDKYVIGYTVWETTKPPDHWIEIINQLDHLLVPTEWNRTIFREHGITIPIDVLPHMSEFRGQKVPFQIFDELKNSEDRFLFYIISTWTERKAIWKLIEAYAKAFDKDEPVELLIKTSKGDTRYPRHILLRYFGYTYQPVQKTVNAYLEKYKDIPKITLIADDAKSNQFIQALHTRGDCYVSLCRGEGWGIGSFEAARYGKPVIMTGFGGQTEYLPAHSAWLLDYELVPVMDENAPKSYGTGQLWAEPDLDQAAKWMRNIYENREVAKQKGETLKKFVIEHFNNDKTANTLIQFISSL